MIYRKFIFGVFIVFTFFSYKNIPLENGVIIGDNEVSTRFSDQYAPLKFDFGEFTLIIPDERVWVDKDMVENSITEDTLVICAGAACHLGGFGGNRLLVETEILKNIQVEQRYKTSMLVSKERAELDDHCILNDWEHFYSDWEVLEVNEENEYITKIYENKKERFPEVKLKDLRNELYKQCGNEWAQSIKKIKSPGKLPSTIFKSHYFLRISGQRKDNSQIINKLIIIEQGLGC